MARELELKFQVACKHDFMDRLQNLGITLSEPVEQVDTIFFRKGKIFEDLESGEPVIRIREENGKVKTTLKKYMNGIMDREEIECEILDAASFHKFLCLMDCVPTVVVRKTRRKGFYHGATITLDSVERLGIYAEIEIVCDNHIADNSRKLEEIAKELGLNMSDVVAKPYDEMLYRKEEKND